MNAGEAPSLLARDREQLDRVARFLRDGRRGFFVVVCRPELRGAALEYMMSVAGKGVPEARRLESPEAAIAALDDVAGAQSTSVVSLGIHAGSAGVWTAVNWHREKLRRGAQVLLWLDSVEALGELREHAPDAYSFREGTLVLEGQSGPAPDWGGEPAEIRNARWLFDLPLPPEERAEAALELARALVARARVDEVARVGVLAILLIPRGEFPLGRQRETRLLLLEPLVSAEISLGMTMDALRHARQGLAELDGELHESSLMRRLGLEIVAALCSPLWPDRNIVEWGIRSLPEVIDPSLTGMVHAAAAQRAMERGHFAAAIQHDTAAADARVHVPTHHAIALRARSGVHRIAGRFHRALADLDAARNAASLAQAEGTYLDATQALLHLDRGELDAAERTFAAHPASFVEGTNRIRVSERHAAAVRRVRGYTRQGLDADGTLLRTLVSERRDGWAYRESTSMVSFLERARDSSAIPDKDILDALALISLVANALIEQAGEDPPWYKVLFPALRARVLSLLPARQEEAFSEAATSVKLARSLWKQALPVNTRTLVQCLARAGRWSDMAPAIEDALQCARDDDHLIAQATVQAYDLVRLLHLSAPANAVTSAFDALKQTFTEMDAPRVEGETWLEVAPYFPLLSTHADHPDVLQIADRAHALFLEMPMPEPAARCMEWLGDIHAARGEPQRAADCYRMSLSTLDRHGFLLRRPLVERKLAALSPPVPPPPLTRA